MRRAAAVLLGVLTMSMLVGACGDDDDDDAASSATTTTAATTATTLDDEGPEGEGVDPMDDASTTPVSVAARSTRALLTDVRAARHEGYDRVVFEFRDAVPGYAVEYVDGPVTQDGSGDEVEVAGEHVVLIRMENASGADTSQESAPQTYTGPNRIDPGTPVVAELVRVGDFEGVLSWAVGLGDRVDYRITTLDDPHRLVVDFRNH